MTPTSGGTHGTPLPSPTQNSGAYNLFDLTYRVARELAAVVEGNATGGSTTTLLDSVNLAEFRDDHFAVGSLWILRDAAGANAAPEGEYARLTASTQSTGTLTFVTGALTIAPAAGDRYAVATSRYRLDQIIAAINQVLAEIVIEVTDIATIATVSGQLEYNLPAALLDDRIDVWIQGVTTDTDANEWEQVYDWYIEETGTGTQKRLVFIGQPAYTNAIRLHYFTPHPPLYLYSSKLRENVDVNKVVLNAAYRLALSRVQDPSHFDQETSRLLGELAARMERQGWRTRKSRAPKLATLGD